MDATGNEISEMIEAENKNEAEVKIRGRGYFVTTIKEVATEVENQKVFSHNEKIELRRLARDKLQEQYPQFEVVISCDRQGNYYDELNYCEHCGRELGFKKYWTKFDRVIGTKQVGFIKGCTSWLCWIFHRSTR